MEEHGVDPDLGSYSHAVTALGSSCMVEEAMSVMRTVMNKALKPTFLMYEAVIDALSKGEKEDLGKGREKSGSFMNMG